MTLRHYTPHPSLRPYVQKLWVFETSGSIPDNDMKLIVPNGLIKLTIPFRNGLSGKMKRWSHISKENSITLIGMTDIPSVVDAEHKGPSGTVGLEFSAIGAYRFFNISQQEIKNQIHALDTVIGTTARKLEERIANTANVNQKIKLIEQFLIQQLDGQAVDTTLEYCVNKIANSTKAE